MKEIELLMLIDSNTNNELIIKELKNYIVHSVDGIFKNSKICKILNRYFLLTLSLKDEKYSYVEVFLDSMELISYTQTWFKEKDKEEFHGFSFDSMQYAKNLFGVDTDHDRARITIPNR